MFTISREWIETSLDLNLRHSRRNKKKVAIITYRENKKKISKKKSIDDAENKSWKKFDD